MKMNGNEAAKPRRGLLRLGAYMIVLGGLSSATGIAIMSTVKAENSPYNDTNITKPPAFETMTKQFSLSDHGALPLGLVLGGVPLTIGGSVLALRASAREQPE